MRNGHVMQRKEHYVGSVGGNGNESTREKEEREKMVGQGDE